MDSKNLNQLHSTVNAQNASLQRWDCIIIGAGPAGSALAISLAKTCKVLLVDKGQFPRYKVCGGCLNKKTANALRKLGLSRLLENPSLCMPLQKLDCVFNKKTFSFPLSGGFVVSRTVLDYELVRHAISLGVSYLGGYAAELGDNFQTGKGIHIKNAEDEHLLRANIVVVATGLSSLRQRDGDSVIESIVAEGSRIGVGTQLSAPELNLSENSIHMCINAEGYLGAVKLADGSIDFAAAIDSAALKRKKSAGHWAAETLHANGYPYSTTIAAATWLGTPSLTRHAVSVASERLFLVGDAASYVEPFTGEGIGWALAESSLLQPLIEASVREWKLEYIELWQSIHRRRTQRSQRFCRLVQKISRSRLLLSVIQFTTKYFPNFMKPVTALAHHGT